MADTLRMAAPYLVVLGLAFVVLEIARRTRVGRRGSWAILAAATLAAFAAAFMLVLVVFYGLAFPDGLVD